MVDATHRLGSATFLHSNPHPLPLQGPKLGVPGHQASEHNMQPNLCLCHPPSPALWAGPLGVGATNENQLLIGDGRHCKGQLATFTRQQGRGEYTSRTQISPRSGCFQAPGSTLGLIHSIGTTCAVTSISGIAA